VCYELREELNVNAVRSLFMAQRSLEVCGVSRHGACRRQWCCVTRIVGGSALLVVLGGRGLTWCTFVVRVLWS